MTSCALQKINVQQAFRPSIHHARQRANLRQQVVCQATATRRDLLQYGVIGGFLGLMPPALAAEKAVVSETSDLCDEACAEKLKSQELITTPSGLSYKDIVVGTGYQAPVGYQVTVNYVAMTPDYKVFDSSIEKGKPYDVRIGSGSIVAGLDEGLRGMKSGGIRRLYVPGNLAFPNSLRSAPGRPRVMANTPVIFDVNLLYIPGDSHVFDEGQGILADGTCVDLVAGP